MWSVRSAIFGEMQLSQIWSFVCLDSLQAVVEMCATSSLAIINKEKDLRKLSFFWFSMRSDRHDFDWVKETPVSGLTTSYLLVFIVRHVLLCNKNLYGFSKRFMVWLMRSDSDLGRDPIFSPRFDDYMGYHYGDKSEYSELRERVELLWVALY